MKPKKQETKKIIQEYNGWLKSNNFLKRAFAIYGHFWAAHIIFILSIGLTALVVTLLVVSILR